VAAAHFCDREAGRRRLAFDELLVDQIVQLRLRAERRAAQAAAPLGEEPTLSRVWRDTLLPFAPTDDQTAAMDEVDADLARERPMQRLLMGEVGSGKTVVALHAMLRAVEHGLQAALMAPTETLAEQHFATLQALMPGSLVPIALLTGSTPAGRRADILGKLRTGELKLVVGTHALIEPDVEFDRLAVAVVDEQHRFGVRQRTMLDAKAPEGLAPHVLHLTATPIPRTLRLANFGALDVTELRRLPKGRQPIETFVAGGERERDRAYERIREELRAGRQAFVVCPLVSESEVLQARAATAEYERLRTGELADFRVVLLHGQMRPREKAAAMEAFAAGEADVLVATTVIEVGIDVPNATVMLVEDAERYGISQLHQLRGRVGRGSHASVCLLFGPSDSPRLRALAQHGDGFRLAEIDLELRGEGELTGTRQSGMARFRFARLPEDGALLQRAHDRALALLRADPELSAPELTLLAEQLAAAEAEPVAA
jgi:ATP-dependent DNA helicase RecG